MLAMLEIFGNPGWSMREKDMGRLLSGVAAPLDIVRATFSPSVSILWAATLIVHPSSLFCKGPSHRLRNELARLNL